MKGHELEGQQRVLFSPTAYNSVQISFQSQPHLCMIMSSLRAPLTYFALTTYLTLLLALPLCSQHQLSNLFTLVLHEHPTHSTCIIQVPRTCRTRSRTAPHPGLACRCFFPFSRPSGVRHDCCTGSVRTLSALKRVISACSGFLA